MSITIQLSPEREELLRAEAERLGQTPEEYVSTMVESRFRPVLSEQEQEVLRAKLFKLIGAIDSSKTPRPEGKQNPDPYGDALIEKSSKYGLLF